MTSRFRQGSKAGVIVAAVEEDANLTTADLAERFSCSRQYVHNVMCAAGIRAAPAKRVWLPRKPAPPPVCRTIPEGGAVQISHSAIGSVSELMVAADLMSRGWSVFFPLFRARSDLIATDREGQIVKRIEVRSGKRKGNELIFNKKPTDAKDHYAIVLVGEPIIYDPPI